MPGRRTKLAAPGIPSRSHLGDRLFVASHSRGTKPPCWRTKVALGQDQQETHVIVDDNFLCLSCPSATFAPQHCGFVPREWLAVMGLLVELFRMNSNRDAHKKRHVCPDNQPGSVTGFI